MIKTSSKYFAEIREYLDAVPVIETHEHYANITGSMENVFDLLGFYYWSDILSASYGMENEINAMLWDNSISFDERYDLFEKYYQKSNKTAYARAMKAGLKECWGIDEINRETFRELSHKIKNRDNNFYDKYLNRFGIKAKVCNILTFDGFKNLVTGKDKEFTKDSRFALPILDLHNIRSIGAISRLDEFVDKKITCLDDYIEAFDNYLKKAISFGIVCFKDQSAYYRQIKFGNPTKAEAESDFNKIVNNPEDQMGTKDLRALDDWLFHYFMRAAQKYNLPVQLHTGHMAGIRNDVAKANAAHLISILELYKDVQFDLFHGNWPYMDDILFIGKNYPNAYIDLCWVQSIDPLYCIELMKRALVTVPHSKIMAFGGDTSEIELTVGYLILARDNVACALSDMVDNGWLNIQEAKEIGADWFYNNPNEFFKLGFEPFRA